MKNKKADAVKKTKATKKKKKARSAGKGITAGAERKGASAGPHGSFAKSMKWAREEAAKIYEALEPGDTNGRAEILRSIALMRD